MNYNDCQNLPNSSIGFYKAQNGNTYYYCVPSQGAGPIPGPQVGASTTAGTPKQCTLYCPDGTQTTFPCNNMPTDPCAGHYGSGAEEKPCTKWCQEAMSNGNIAVWCCDANHTPKYPMPASPYIPTSSIVAQPVTISPNAHGNVTVTYADGSSHGLAFQNGQTVSYPMPTVVNSTNG